MFDDNDAVIKVTIRRLEPDHETCFHRIDLTWLFDRINSDQTIQIKYVNTSEQLADILTKGSFSRERWSQLIHLFHLIKPHTYSCSHLSV